jgi:hypothetical protein
MSMKKVYDAVCVTGKYTDRSGKEKTRYLNVGVVLQGDKGYSMKLEALPVNFDGWINFYEPKAREQTSDQPKQEAPADEGFDDSAIPF